MQRTFLAISRVGLIWVCLQIASCGGEPFTYTPSSEVKAGPGLFSGEDGEFTIIGPESPESEGGKESVPQGKLE